MSKFEEAIWNKKFPNVEINYNDFYDLSKENSEEYLKIALVVGQELEYKNQWIPFDLVKPTEQGHYLVSVKNSYPKNCNVVVAEFYEDNNMFYSESSEAPIYDVTHWKRIEFIF
jgi:hypothetical protein